MLFNLNNTKLRIVVCDYYRRQGNSGNSSYYSYNNTSNTCLADMIVIYDVNGSKNILETIAIILVLFVQKKYLVCI